MNIRAKQPLGPSMHVASWKRNIIAHRQAQNSPRPKRKAYPIVGSGGQCEWDFYIASSLHACMKGLSKREALVCLEIVEKFKMYFSKALSWFLFSALLCSQCALSVHLPRGSLTEREAVSKTQRQHEPRYSKSTTSLVLHISFHKD